MDNQQNIIDQDNNNQVAQAAAQPQPHPMAMLQPVDPSLANNQNIMVQAAPGMN